MNQQLGELLRLIGIYCTPTRSHVYTIIHCKCRALRITNPSLWSLHVCPSFRLQTFPLRLLQAVKRIQKQSRQSLSVQFHPVSLVLHYIPWTPIHLSASMKFVCTMCIEQSSSNCNINSIFCKKIGSCNWISVSYL